jgi:hypothetical protein
LKRNGPYSRTRSKCRVVHVSPFALDAGAHVVERPFVKANKMREITNGHPVDVDALMARLEKKCDDMGMHEGSLAKKKKGRERTVQGALAELQL